jgi:hypothetical protein
MNPGATHKRIISYLSARILGATDEEMALDLGIPANSLRPRRQELVRMGKVEASANRRLTFSGSDATVWVVCDHEPGEPPPRTRAKAIAEAAAPFIAKAQDLVDRYPDSKGWAVVSVTKPQENNMGESKVPKTPPKPPKRPSADILGMRSSVAGWESQAMGTDTDTDQFMKALRNVVAWVDELEAATDPLAAVVPGLIAGLPPETRLYIVGGSIEMASAPEVKAADFHRLNPNAVAAKPPLNS